MKRPTRRAAVGAMLAVGAGPANYAGTETAEATEGGRSIIMTRTQTPCAAARAFAGQHQPRPLPVEAEELADGLRRQHLGVREGGLRAAAALAAGRRA